MVDAVGSPPDVLVLNGPGPKVSSALELKIEEIENAEDTLLKFHVELCQLILPYMMRNGWGRIVAIGSRGVVEPIEGLALSNIGRAALLGYLKTLSAEVAKFGITVNVVVPGRIATERTAAIDASRARSMGVPVEEVARSSAKAIPVGRYGLPHEFAAVVAFLCSESASYTTGSLIRCDGGLIKGF